MNTTFTNCAEKKAKQFLNLLQGYTKGIRITAILILLLMGVSNAWGATKTTVYYAVPTSVVGSYTVKCNVNYKGDGNDWQQHTMTKTDKTYDGDPIYSCTFTDKYDGLGCLQFQLYDGNTHKGEQQPITSWTSAGTYNGKLWKHNQSGWKTYRYDQHGFEAANNGIKYYSNLNANDEEWNFNGQSAQTKELGEVTSLYLKEWFVQLYENWAGAQGNIKFQYNIHPTANSAGNYTDITKGWEDSGNWNNGWLYPKYGNSKQNINLLNGLPGSGKYTMSFKYYDSDLKLTSPVHKLNWTYNIVPSVNNFEVTASNVVSGTGTSGDPYVIAYGKTTTLTVSGDKASTDANSSLYAKFGNNNYSSTLTQDLTPNPTKQSIEVKAKYYNSSDDLSGIEKSTTIYYRAENLYTVTFNANGHGTAPTEQKISEGSKATEPTPAPQETGYTFGGWYKETNCTNAFDFNIVITEDITLYAKWTPKTYAITLNANGGASNGSATATYNSSTITNLTHPTRTDYSCNGYYTATSGGTLVLNIDGTLAKNVSGYTDANGNWTKDDNATLYAQWTYDVTEYTVTFGAGTGFTSYGTVTAKNNSTSATITSPAQVRSQHNVTFTATPETGYEVEGWYTNAECTTGRHNAGNTTYTITITAATNVYVKFVEKKWSVAFAAGTGGSVTTPSSTPQTVGQVTGISIAATPATGYTFNQWTITSGAGSFTSEATTNSNTFKPTNNSTVTASFDETMSTLTTSNKYDVGNPEYAIPTKSVNSIGVATTATVKATAAGNGYTFVGWELTNCERTDGGANNATTITVRSNGDGKAATVVANYAEDLTTSWVLKGSFVDDFKTAYDFVKKSGESTGKVAYVSLDLADSKAYQFKVVNGNTWYGNNNSNAQYWIKETVENWEFYSDAGNCHMQSSVAGTYTFKIDFSGTYPKVSVYFPTAYTLTYGSGAGGSGTVTANNSIKSGDLVLAGTSVSLTADPADGYDFAAWYSDQACEGAAISSNNPYTFSINSNTTLYAKWKAQSFTLTWELNGGRITIEGTQAGSVETGTTLVAPTVEKDHYDFAGWDPTVPKTMPAANVTYTAQWTPKEYAITYKDQGDKTFSGTHANGYPTTHTYNTTTTLLGATKSGYTFAGWYRDSECAGARVETLGVDVTEAITLYAKWDVASYTITFDKQEGTGGTTSVTAQYGAKLSAITIPSRDGYLFDGYYTQTSGNGTKYYNADGTTTKTMPHNVSTLYAKWIPYSQCIFFKNTLDWKNVYVYTFSDNVWYDNEDSNTQYGPGVCTKVNVLEFAKMTQIDNTDIYYYILTKQAGFNHIAFSDADMNNWNEFYGNKAIYRADRNDQLPLFIPKKSQTPTTTNSTKYYSSGIWMKYNSTESGYDWRGATDENNQEQWSKKIDFTASKPGGYSFTATVEFDNTSTHYFKIHNTKGDWFGNGGTMTQNNCTDWTFGSDNTQNAKITPTITGKYIFTVYLGDGEVSVSLDYPLSVGDYRLAYKDKTPASHHPGHYLKKHSTSQIDIVSFFIHYDQEPVIFVEKCADIQNGIPTWEKVTEITNNPAASITESGVYNFSLQQIEGESLPILVNEAMPYTGNYYIRTDAAEGGWDSFRQQSNQITYSSFADAHSNFNHYYCKYIEAGRNVKFTIANDYSYCISDTLDNDPIIEKGQSSVGCLPINANVRFGWDSNTNEISRAYIKGAGQTSDRFLVLQGQDGNLTDANGNELTKGDDGTKRYGLEANEEILVDQQNWIYQVDVTANNQTFVKLIAEYNGQTQYFKGAADGENQYIPVLTGGASGNYKIRFIYNFKSNHLVTAWLADGNNITENKVLGTDLMIIRENQAAAAQLRLNSNETKLSEVGTIYATMTFTKTHLESTDASEWERLYYWISFPFDVRISDVFGFGEYGKQWIIEYYDGAARAKNGYWLESDTYWKYISDTTYVAGKSNEDANGNPNNGVLVANKGYVLALARSIANQGLFKNGNEDVRLYFPSMNKIGSIDGDMQNVVTLLQEYPCTITGREAYDNNWHMIGVPSYADKDHTLTQDKLIYYYEYQASSNTYQVTTAQLRDPDISSSNAERVTFKSMHSYMVQYAGTINWRNWATTPQQLAARRNTHSEQDTYSLRLELQRNGTYADQTFVQLKDESTTDYDMNIDLTKLMNSGTNIYTLAGEQRIQLAGSVIPVAETTIPVGVKVAAAGEYTLAMPDGTDGITALLIDYETNTTTDLLLSDYTVTLPKGSTENRFALIVKPRKTATRMENIGEGAKDADKYIIDGALYLQRDGKLYNAQGQIMR